MAAKLTRLTHKIAIHLYHLQFSLQATSPETFGYTLVYCSVCVCVRARAIHQFTAFHRGLRPAVWRSGRSEQCTGQTPSVAIKKCALHACYHSVQRLLSPHPLTKSLRIKAYKNVILPRVLYGCETWSLILREERRLRTFENSVLRRIFRPSGAHPASYPVGTGSSFPGGKAAGA
jgi:hypothetical protein